MAGHQKFSEVAASRGNPKREARVAALKAEMDARHIGEPGHCAECGRPTTGKLCMIHETARKRITAAREAAERDAEVLAILAEPGMNPSRLAVRIGVSRPAARNRVLNAKRRQALLAEA